MTKNRFLSKRLACLLTTALISTPILFSTTQTSQATTALAVTEDASITAGHTTITFDGAAADVLTITPTAAGLTYTGAVTSTAATAVPKIVAAGISASAPGVATFNSTVGAATRPINIDVGTTALGGAATFDAAVVTTTLNVLGGDHANEVATATFKGNLTATAVVLDSQAASGAATAAFTGTSAQTVAGTINAGTAGEGVISVSNSSTAGVTFSGIIGGTAAPGSLTVASGSKATLSAAATLTAATVTGTAVLSGASTITTATIAGTLTNSSTLASTTTTVSSGGTLNLDGIGTITSLVVTGTTNVGVINQVPAIITLNSGGIITTAKTLVATAAGDAVFKTTDQLGGTINSGGKIVLPSRLKNGETINLIDDSDTTATAATLRTALDLVVADNALADHTSSAYSATGKTASTGTVYTSTNKAAATTASELGVNVNKATAFLQARDAAIAADIATTDTASLSSIYNVLYALSGQSATADTAFANQVSPQTDTITGSTVAAKAVTSGVQNVISTRLASLRSGDAYSTGIVTGSHMGANSGFIQAFGSQVEQKNKGNEFGYDADTTGFAIGFDTKVPGGAVIGISYAHSEADVDGKGTGRAKNDIKTDSVSLYADYATKDGYVEGSITYGKSDNKGSRVINTGGLTNTYTSNSDSEQYSFRLSGGIPQSLGGGAFITPFAAATISQIKADAYTETSTTANDALRLRVSQDTVDSQVGSVGVKFHQAIKDGKTTFTPEVKLAINQEFGDGNITTTNTYQGGGASFKNSTAIEKTSATAGLGVNISSDNLSFNIGYEADVKDKYLGHSAQAKLTAKF